MLSSHRVCGLALIVYCKLNEDFYVYSAIQLSLLLHSSKWELAVMDMTVTDMEN